eukprot:TRINITY_DN5285_c0_g1::TRINITY_DN5285_c0_g1_i1::g.23443::m.23443 TRINITY_DN5285_c0_g1::TRINITY_DN5285_c0_g1_i1::g.23443  ORF type:complete len:526 (-),score=46.14,sp/Q7Y214/GTE7_ARATH/42.00/2e-11,Bromodomain/PF00439.20/2.2e-13,PHD/PF00628.24/2.8e+03,PHD/PF00628.24/1.7e-08,Hrs_helical/PF12210.3/0.23,Chorion_2/PF03964.10/1,Fer4_7/PF12838.2/9.3e+02,Fer4_7/PF12838.2/5.8,PHD_2/PF13831.1/3.2e+02,PHD_2/PF13831.1/7.1e+03,PHD_2/PF13831.1/0.036,zf-HC5HC2H/PF13771.1/5.6e+03,zf-HC5HC2H/PF13771.1/0.79,C1_1/PF
MSVLWTGTLSCSGVELCKVNAIALSPPSDSARNIVTQFQSSGVDVKDRVPPKITFDKYDWLVLQPQLHDDPKAIPNFLVVASKLVDKQMFGKCYTPRSSIYVVPPRLVPDRKAPEFIGEHFLWICVPNDITPAPNLGLNSSQNSSGESPTKKPLVGHEASAHPPVHRVDLALIQDCDAKLKSARQALWAARREFREKCRAINDTLDLLSPLTKDTELENDRKQLALTVEGNMAGACKEEEVWTDSGHATSTSPYENNHHKLNHSHNHNHRYTVDLSTSATDSNHHDISLASSSSTSADSGTISATRYKGTMSASELNSCSQLLEHLMKKKDATGFTSPALEIWPQLEAVGYFGLVRRPMDLGTVRTKLRAGGYPDPGSFVTDLMQTFDNALLFNSIGDEWYCKALRLKCWACARLGLRLPAKQGVPQDEYNFDDCTHCGQEGKLLCCDRCPNSFHVACLNLKSFPKDEQWFCPDCIPIIHGNCPLPAVSQLLPARQRILHLPATIV